MLRRCQEAIECWDDLRGLHSANTSAPVVASFDTIGVSTGNGITRGRVANDASQDVIRAEIDRRYHGNDRPLDRISFYPPRVQRAQAKPMPQAQGQRAPPQDFLPEV